MESTLDDASSRDEELPVVVACEGGFVLILTSPPKKLCTPSPHPKHFGFQGLCNEIHMKRHRGFGFPNLEMLGWELK